jgi:putative ABC transport system substrate-binding protein
MRRREFVAGLSVAAGWPKAARAQQRTMPVVGILGSATAEVYASRMAAFMQGLKEAGFVPGQNVVLEQRWANDQYDRLPEMAADLVRAKVSLIAAIGNNLPTRAAKAATSTIPIVFAMGSNPVGLGLVASLNRPGGNITGVTSVAGELLQKRFQLLHDLVPNARRFGFLLNPDNPANLADVDPARAAVRTWDSTVEVGHARVAREFDATFANFAERRVEAIAISADALFFSERERLIQSSAPYAVPIVHFSVEAVRAGGLMSYGASFAAVFRDAGLYVGRILKGEKPADLPVVQPTKFEFAINLKTAKALGLTIPRMLLVAADEVIE